MLSDLCEQEDHGACFENELDGCCCICHPDPEDCPAGDVLTTEYTGTGRAHDPAAIVPPTAAAPGAGSPPTAPGTSPAAVAIPRSQAAAGDPASSAAVLQLALGTAADHTPAGGASSATAEGANVPSAGSTPGKADAPGERPGSRTSGYRPGRGDPAHAPLRPGQSIAAAMSEDRGPDSLDAHVRRLMKDLNLRGYHTRDSRRSAKGYPDWTIVGPYGLLFRELKTQRGRVSADQQDWLDALATAGADAGTWRPEDLLSGRVAQELTAISLYRRAA